MSGAETVTSIVEALGAGRCSAEEVVETVLQRIESPHDDLNAFISFDADRARACARAVDQARARGERLGPLAGVPIAVKDNICTSFGATTCGSKILAPFESPYDAFEVERLEAAGAIIVGKTNLDEFAMGSSTENSAYCATLNPWDRERVSGGSSGGSAAAVAAGLIPCALGSDTGGSIRQPASFCGVVGLKPTYGLVSRFGLVAFGSSLDQIGPITRDVRDSALILGRIAGHDPRDSTSVDRPLPDYSARLDQSLSGIRIGVSDDGPGEGLDVEVREAIQEAIQVMVRNGAQTVSIDLPHEKYAVACYYIIAPAEASSNLARFDGVRYGRRCAHPKDMADLYASSRGEGFGAEAKRRIMLGTYALSSGYYDAYYIKALKVRTLIQQDFDRAFEKVDVIASPVAPTTAFRLGEKVQDPLSMYLGDVYTISANLAGICAISVPAGLDQKGMPIGLQLIGPAFGEETLLAVAYQYEQRAGHPLRRPPRAPALETS